MTLLSYFVFCHRECMLSCSVCGTLWTAAHQAPLYMEFSKQEYRSMLPFSTPGDFPNPRIESVSLESPALAGGFFTTEPPGKPECDCQRTIRTSVSTGDVPPEGSGLGGALGRGVANFSLARGPGMVSGTAGLSQCPVLIPNLLLQATGAHCPSLLGTIHCLPSS